MWLALLIFAAFSVRGSQPENLCAERGSCCTGRSDRYSLTNPQVQGCTVLYRPFRHVQPHQSAGTGLYCAVPAVQTGTGSPVGRYRTVLCCTGRSDRYSLSVGRYRTVLYCTGRSDRYSLTNPQVQDCTVLYRPFRHVQPHQSAGTGLYCAVPAVQKGKGSPIGRYRTVLGGPGRSDRYKLTNRRIQDCTLLYWSFRQVKAHQSAGTGLYCTVLYWSFRQVQPHQSAGTGLYFAVLVIQIGTASPIRRYRTALCCTGCSDRYSLTNPQVQDCTVLYWSFR
jgi:hypothetical protein